MKNVICFSTSQLATLRVPPYRPGAPPWTPWTAFRVASSVGEGETGEAELSFAVDSVNGSGPVSAAGWRKTSPSAVLVPPSDAPVPPPSGRVSTTARITAATTAVAISATRGTDPHQGRRGSGACPPPLGGSEGGPPPDGGWEGPDSGPEGGPVGRPDDGGSTLTCSSSRVGSLRPAHTGRWLVLVYTAFSTTSSLCAPVPYGSQADADGPPGGRPARVLLSVAA
ncbi:hypothetical protein STAFG_0943 [Streptomyces afghaniensis 772]|uniref:Uncharacterized protein n=1 Tax=Streptomyces afghaniensis 772 TaxID=1283301 RepID=S4MY31_9ACTN|nr:hypothetical protein STAFG_0943 [Streptomyces afghaniensis 772]